MVSSTGVGAAILRVMLAKVVADRMAAGDSAAAAAAASLAQLARVGGQAGVIAVDRSGAVGFAANTPHMSYASNDASGTEQFGYEMAG